MNYSHIPPVKLSVILGRFMEASLGWEKKSLSSKETLHKEAVTLKTETQSSRSIASKETAHCPH